jgi:hypothetical protein
MIDGFFAATLRTWMIENRNEVNGYAEVTHDDSSHHYESSVILFVEFQ